MSGIVLSSSVRPEPALAAVDRRSPRHHAEPLVHRQEGQHCARQSDQLLHGAVARQPRQRHQQPARRHRQRRAGAAGRQHRHHLAPEAGRQRQVGRQPGLAGCGRLFPEVAGDDRRDHRRHHRRYPRHRHLQQCHPRRQRPSNDNLTTPRADHRLPPSWLVSARQLRYAWRRPRPARSASAASRITFSTSQTTSRPTRRRRDPRHRRR